MAQVVPLHPSFEELNTNVVAISFGLEYWARTWIEETQAPFPIWLDPGRKSYQAFNLTRSWTAAWGVRNLLFYAKAYLRGQKIRNQHRGDTDQMGGNFIVDSEGIVRLVHRSQDPTDRPNIETLLEVLKDIERERIREGAKLG